jgi:hypothetical protein
MMMYRIRPILASQPRSARRRHTPARRRRAKRGGGTRVDREEVVRVDCEEEWEEGEGKMGTRRP